MAVVNTLSAILTGSQATPYTVNSRDVHSRLHTVSAFVAVAAADDDNSTYRMHRVHSSWTIKSIQVFCTAITGGTDYDVGLYTINGGAVVDADLYADGISLATAAPAVPPTAAANGPIEVRFGDAATAVLTDINNQVWEDLGLASDPALWYDLVLTANTVGTAAGTIAVVTTYNAGD